MTLFTIRLHFIVSGVLAKQSLQLKIRMMPDINTGSTNCNKSFGRCNGIKPWLTVLSEIQTWFIWKMNYRFSLSLSLFQYFSQSCTNQTQLMIKWGVWTKQKFFNAFNHLHSSHVIVELHVLFVIRSWKWQLFFSSIHLKGFWLLENYVIMSRCHQNTRWDSFGSAKASKSDNMRPPARTMRF